MRAGGSGHARAALAAMLAFECWCSAGAAIADPSEGQRSDLRQLASRAKDIRIERRRWNEDAATVETAASARVTSQWLGRLIGAGFPESGRWPDSLCAAACQRCPDQLRIDITFEVAKGHCFLGLYLREGLALLNTDLATIWSLADSLGPVLAIIREGLPKDELTQAWNPPSPRPAPPDADSAAYHGDYVMATGMPEVLTKVPPRYPALAREKGRSGVVDVQALVAADGSVSRVRAAKFDPDFNDAALEAVRAWRFRPATCGGRAVPVWVSIPVRFTLR